MSHLRAPAARADRREGGRHGRPVARPVPALPETCIRPQLMRLAVLPPVAVALSGCAAVLFTVRSTGAPPSLSLLAVLTGAVSVTAAGIVIAAVAAGRAARSVSDRVETLRRSTARGEADLLALVETLRRGETPPPRRSRGGPPADADDFELLAADLSRAHDGAVTAVVQAAQLSSQTGSEQKLEVFVNLARRLQSLVHREISILDELENEIEDPDLLKGLFHVDHLATRIRRHAENLAVLGGAVSRRQWSNPVPMTEVLRSAIAEVEQYSRVKLVPPIDGELRGHAVADVIHLLAELVENATVFSAPHTQVLLRANLVTSGLAVEVEDRGLGMPVGEQSTMNALLADPDQVNVGSLLADGRIGLFVVSQLARRHGIHVRLQSNIYGGVQAVLVVPQSLLGSAAGGAGAVPQPRDAGDAPPGPDGVTRPSDALGPSDGGDAPAPAAPAIAGPGARPAAAPGGPPTDRRPAPQPGPAAPAVGGRRRHAQPGGAPAPLPTRGTRQTRPNPAEALPGIRPEDRSAVAEHAGAPPVPRVGTVRGTMGKPQLPRRRAQEHIVPQLRGGPAPRQDSETTAGHDPGLMAAFQRGIGLAEAQQHLEAAQPEQRTAAGPVGGPRGETLATGLNGTGVTDLGRLGTGPTGMGVAGPGVADPGVPGTGVHDTSGAGLDAGSGVIGFGARTEDVSSSASHATHADGVHMDLSYTGATHADFPHTDLSQTGAPHTDLPHTDVTHTEATASGHSALGRVTSVHPGPAPTGPAQAAAAPADPPTVSPAPAHAPILRPLHASDRHARPDGSAPAG
ncbi:sensor histidine kinase [Streptomyces sp. NPDC101237]|uniref:sensor histidine kinase n=1 Tax=Streptomyces sp. NPDC101237 TaxID=3366139 RepID=UPI00382E7742